MSDTSKQTEIEATLGLGAGRRRGRAGRWLWLLVVAVLAAGGWWWWQGAQGGSDGPVYRTTAVTRGDITITVTATGTVEPTNVVDISSELSGTLAEVMVDFNDTVTKGQALAQVQVANADRALAAANLELSRTELEKACICSPINGVVLDRQADTGQIVAASLSAPTLFTVAEDLTQMEVQVAVDEADIGHLAPGNEAKFTVEAYDERVFEAKIIRILYAPETVDGVVTYSATLSLANPDLALRPGMTATAEITVAEEKDRMLVPNAALRFAPAVEEESSGGSGLLGMIMPRPPSDGNGTVSPRTVWVLRDGAAVELPVETGASNGKETIVTGEGLAVGDLVITGQER